MNFVKLLLFFSVTSFLQPALSEESPSKLKMLISSSNTMPLGDFVGITITAGILKDINEKLANKLGLELENVVVARARINQLLKDGTADGICYLIPEWFQEIKDDVNWTDPVFINREIIIANKSSPKVESLALLKDKKIGTVLSYVYSSLEEKIGGKFERDDSKSVYSNILKVANRRVPYAAVDEYSYQYYSKQPDIQSKLSDTIIAFDSINGRCAFSKQSNISFEKIKKAFAELAKEHEFQKIFNNYLK